MNAVFLSIHQTHRMCRSAARWTQTIWPCRLSNRTAPSGSVACDCDVQATALPDAQDTTILYARETRLVSGSHTEGGMHPIVSLLPDGQPCALRFSPLYIWRQKKYSASKLSRPIHHSVLPLLVLFFVLFTLQLPSRRFASVGPR